MTVADVELRVGELPYGLVWLNQIKGVHFVAVLCDAPKAASFGGADLNRQARPDARQHALECGTLA